MATTFTPLWKELWTQLSGREHLWHQTSLHSLEGIVRDQEIIPNTGKREVTWPQSRFSYGLHLGAVSLFDFATSDERNIFEHEYKWGSVLTGKLPVGVLICLQRNALDRDKLLLPSEIANNDRRLNALHDEIRRGRVVIPAVEALHIGPIPAIAFRSFILTAGDGCGGYLWQKFEPSSNSFRILSDTSDKWSIDHQRWVEERRASGECTWP